jgi:hypothetical protein
MLQINFLSLPLSTTVGQYIHILQNHFSSHCTTMFCDCMKQVYVFQYLHVKKITLARMQNSIIWQENAINGHFILHAVQTLTRYLPFVQ